MEPFLGQLALFGFDFAPRGWMFCDGQLLPIAQYSALFSLLGTTYGGDGRTTFGVPDLRGRAPIHFGHGAGLSNRILGAMSGAEVATLTVANLPAHSHPLHAVNATANVSDPDGARLAVPAAGTIYTTASADSRLAADSVGSSGGS